MFCCAGEVTRAETASVAAAAAVAGVTAAAIAVAAATAGAVAGNKMASGAVLGGRVVLGGRAVAARIPASGAGAAAILCWDSIGNGEGCVVAVRACGLGSTEPASAAYRDCVCQWQHNNKKGKASCGEQQHMTSCYVQVHVP